MIVVLVMLHKNGGKFNMFGTLYEWRGRKTSYTGDTTVWKFY